MRSCYPELYGYDFGPSEHDLHFPAEPLQALNLSPLIKACSFQAGGNGIRVCHIECVIFVCMLAHTGTFVFLRFWVAILHTYWQKPVKPSGCRQNFSIWKRQVRNRCSGTMHLLVYATDFWFSHFEGALLAVSSVHIACQVIFFLTLY